MCHGVFDPARDPLGYRNMPAVSYLVYPTLNGSVSPSIRELQMRDAINDYSALKLLESKIGRDATLKLCDAFFGEPVSVYTVPRSGDEMLSFRALINQKIEEIC